MSVQMMAAKIISGWQCILSCSQNFYTRPNFQHCVRILRQSSDWKFVMHKATSTDSATRRHGKFDNEGVGTSLWKVRFVSWLGGCRNVVRQWLLLRAIILLSNHVVCCRSVTSESKVIAAYILSLLLPPNLAMTMIIQSRMAIILQVTILWI